MKRVRLRWAIAGALLLLAVVLGWRWSLRAAPAQRAVEAEIPAVTLSAASGAWPTESPVVSRPTGAASSPAQIADAQWCSEPPDPEPDEATAASAPVITSPAEFREMMRAKPGYRKFSDAADQVQAQWSRALASQGSERALAASDFLAAPAFEQAAALDRLVARARVTQDGFVYALALQSCNMTGRPAACEGLSARQWARIDPGNLQPWLLEAGRAQAAKDPQALREAMFQIASSTHSQTYTNELAARLLAQPASDQPGLAMAAQMNVLVNVTLSVWSTPSFSPLTRWCSTATQDANRAQTCDQMAEKLWTGANTLVDAVIAAKLVKGLPASQTAAWEKRNVTVDAVRALIDSDLTKRMHELESASPDALNNCFGLLSDSKMVRQRAAVGEWASFLHSLKNSGQTDAEQATIVAEWRADQARKKAQQQAQAQAASAASAVTKP